MIPVNICHYVIWFRLFYMKISVKNFKNDIIYEKSLFRRKKIFAYH